MRANYTLKRLYVPHDLALGGVIVPDTKQTHYLLHVLRLNEGAEVLLFNGRDGEWLGRLCQTTKRATQIECMQHLRLQDNPATLELMFAPLKTGRLDYLIQKAVEMGAGVLTPIHTMFTQNARISGDKLDAYVQEAAEQCGVLALPDIQALERLDQSAIDRRAERIIIFCDEAHETNGPLDALQALNLTGPLSLLIGPEGGFSDDEREFLHSAPHVHAIPLGPRILRADTAAVAALALIQATHGDWRD